MKSMIFFVCMGCIVLLSPFAYAQLSYMEQDTDRPGLDLEDFNLPRANPEMCRAGCDANPQCRAWTYVRPNTTQGPEPRCWLKNVVPAAVSNACCVSGIKLELDTDRPGFDYSNFDLPRAEPALCQEACFMDSRCEAWTYVRPNRHQGPQARCWLKSAVPDPVPNDCCISAID